MVRYLGFILILMSLMFATRPAVSEMRSLQCQRDMSKYPLPRDALVIGNGSYQKTAIWPSLGEVPINDATDVANALCSMGFDVTLGTNLRAVEQKAALDAF